MYDATLRTYEYKDFIKNFTSKRLLNGSQKLDGMLNDWLFFEVLENMESLGREYWSKLFRQVGINKLLATNLFRTYYPLFLEYLKKYSSVYDEKSYYRLQNMLRRKEVEINYHICDIVDLHRFFDGKTYDLFILGNILQYYKSIPMLDNVYDIDR